MFKYLVVTIFFVFSNHALGSASLITFCNNYACINIDNSSRQTQISPIILLKNIPAILKIGDSKKVYHAKEIQVDFNKNTVFMTTDEGVHFLDFNNNIFTLM